MLSHVVLGLCSLIVLREKYFRYYCTVLLHSQESSLEGLHDWLQATGLGGSDKAEV